MELTNDLTLQFLSSVNNDLFFAFDFFVTGVETYNLYVSVRVTSTIKLSIRETFKILMLSFPGEKQMSNLK